MCQKIFNSNLRVELSAARLFSSELSGEQKLSEIRKNRELKIINKWIIEKIIFFSIVNLQITNEIFYS